MKARIVSLFLAFSLIAAVLIAPAVTADESSDRAGRDLESATVAEWPVDGPIDSIIGGAPTVQNEYPWMARLEAGGQHWCGGVLVDRYAVVTAAHCVDGTNISRVLLGDHRIGTHETTEQWRYVHRAVMHPSYNPNIGNQFDHDIAVLLLEGPARVTRPNEVDTIGIGPRPAAGAQAVVSGWGRTGWNQPVSDVLRDVTLTVQNNNTCPLTVTNNMICAGDASEGACFADSGGPLVDNQNRLVGVVSFGSGFCNSATAFTRVENYQNWIQTEINNHMNGYVACLADCDDEYDLCMDDAWHWEDAEYCEASYDYCLRRCD